jgi:WD40 repeat protein
LAKALAVPIEERELFLQVVRGELNVDSLSLSGQPIIFSADGSEQFGGDSFSTGIQQIVNPYKGLRAFEEADADDFFGRDSFVTRLLDRLSAGSEKDQTTPEVRVNGRFLAVVGPSGSGKSSVIKAGLLPALRRGRLPGAHKWFIAEMTPGSQPLEELEAALLRVAVNPPTSLLKQFNEDQRGILRAIKRVLPNDPAVELLLFIDQFEELFTLVEDPDTRQCFLDGLLAAVSETGSRLRVVLTLRADFYDRPLLYPGLGELVRMHNEVVLTLTAEELTEAIRRPAERVGVTFEDDLVPVIVSEVISQPGALPLMQYALTELFDHCQNGLLTQAAYRQTGGVLGAPSRRAENVYSNLNLARREVTRQLFLRLVTLGEGVEDTRRRLGIPEMVGLVAQSVEGDVAASSGEQQEVREVLETFGKTRLLSFDRDPHSQNPTVEIAHEALLREWGRLKLWLNEVRAEVRLQRALGSAAGEWVTSGCDPSFLLRGTRLDQFESWAEETLLALNNQERDYLKASRSARDARQKVEQVRQTRLATLERRSRRILQALVSVLLVAMLVSLGLADAARRQANLATAQGLALAARMSLSVDHELSIMLALQSLETMYTTSGEEALRNALDSFRVRFSLEGDREFTSMAFSPRADRIATLDNNGFLQFWDVRNGDELFSKQIGDGGGYITYSLDGSRLVAGMSDGSILILDTLSGRIELPPLTGHTSWFNEIAFSPDGKVLSSVNNDGTFRIWEPTTGEAWLILESPPEGVLFGNALAFIPGSDRMLVSDSNGNNLIIDIQTGEVISSLPSHLNIRDLMSSHDVSPDGSWLAATSGNVPTIVDIWDLNGLLEGRTEHPLFSLEGHKNTIATVDFNPEGRILASGSFDSTVKLWQLSPNGGQELMTLNEHSGPIRKVRFSPDGSSLAAMSMDGKILVWDITSQGGGDLLTLVGHEDIVSSIAYNMDGSLLASAGFDGTVRLWDTVHGNLIHTFDHHQGMVYSVTFNPDGKYLASSGEDFTVRISEVASGKEIMIMKEHEDVHGHRSDYKVGGLFPGVMAVAFSPDGRLIASTGEDSTLRVWDFDTGSLLNTHAIHPNQNGGTNLAFSPSGDLLLIGTDGLNPENNVEGPSLAAIWHIDNGRELIILEDLPGRVWGIAFSPDGRLFALSGFGGFLTIHETNIGEELFSLTGHTSTIITVAFSPDGSRLVSAGVDLPKVWDIKKREVLFHLPGHSGYVTSLAFNPDGTRLATAGQDGTIRIYAIDLDELKAIALRRLTRWFTPDECRQYLNRTSCPPLNESP